MSEPIYLDHNASAPLDPGVRDAMEPYWGAYFGNSRSAHAHGARIKAAIEQARAQVAKLLGANPDELLFTSGGSESDNLAIKGLAWANTERKHLIAGAVEHYAVTCACEFLARQGRRFDVAQVDGFGRVEPREVERVLRDDTLLCCVQHANNEVGTVNDVAAIARAVQARGARLLVDAAQSVGKLPVHVDELGADLLTVAAHKFGGPQGIGALYVRRGVKLEPLVHGAGHELNLRSGTHSAALIVGLGKAAELAAQRQSDDALRMRALRDRLFAALKRALPSVHLNGHPEQRLPQTLNVSFPGVPGYELLEKVPEIAASTGAACHAGVPEASLTMKAIGAPAEIAIGAIRLSLGRRTTEAEVDAAAEAIIRGVKSLLPA